MKTFSELNIKPETKPFSGDKMEIDRIVNKEIAVLDYKIVDSKFAGKGNGKCLHMQFKLNDNTHVLFTGSGVLMEMIEKAPKDAFPFKTTIIKEHKRYEFT